MNYRAGWYGCLLSIVLLICLGCSEAKPHEEASGGVTGGDVVATPSESVPPPAMFPHSSDWATPAVHGSWVVQYGLDQCLACHKKDSAQSENPPTCTSCHPLFPHTSDWVQKERHGTTVLKEGKAVCMQCHGSDLAGGITGISCTACHTIYPHPAGWATPAQHGEAAKGKGRQVCQQCHGQDLSGGEPGSGKAQVSCHQCHKDYPHTADWGKLEQHGVTAAKQGTQDCAMCHGTDLQGGMSGVSCTSCHNLYPHPDQWKQKHGAMVQQVGKGVCQGCHGTDFKKPLGGQTCYSCHPDYPHPISPVWRPFTGGHGERVQKNYGKDTANCELCHGSDLQAVQQGKNCFTCHPAYPHQKVTTLDWGDYEGHGAYALQHSKTECQQCHGTNYRGGTRGNPSCYQCHVSYPHTEGWLQPKGVGLQQGHGVYVRYNSSNSCATARCHGVGLVPDKELSKGPGCDSCHASYPHPAGWKQGTVHGPVARAQIAVCKDCHGAGLDQAPSGYQSCKDCHASYLQHPSAGLGGEAWATAQGHGQYVSTNPVTQKKNLQECQLCHGADYSGGISNQGCKTCHASFPHETTPNWQDPTQHGFYVLKDLKQDKTPCQACHGVDFKGGLSGVSCQACHQNSYPHEAGWKDPMNHGVHVVKDLQGDKTSCQQCHGNDLKGGIAEVSCYGCHVKSYPHEAAWKDPTNHGVYVLTELQGDKTSCQKCHGADLQGGISGRSCFESGCHTTPITHEAGWKDPTQHGSYVVETLKNDKSSCQKCHGSDFKGGVSKVSCYGCHANNYPHAVSWKDPTNHGIYVLNTLKGNKSSCQQCHGIDFQGGISGKSCFGGGCHAAAMTHEANWKDPTQHGTYLKDGLKGDMGSCKTCHGNDLKGGTAGVACAQCHDTYPHQMNWKDPTQHGVYVLKNLKDDKTVCKQCHGADLQGGISGVSCSQCHADYPHSADWKNWQKHGIQGMGMGMQSCGDGNCHKSDLKGDVTLGIPSCYTCHDAYPRHDPMALWDSGHGSYVLQTLGGNKAPCQKCHGDDFKGGITGVACNNCHYVYPHETVPNWKGIGMKAIHAISFITNMEDTDGATSACTECHGTNYDTSLNGVSCIGCHPKGITHRIQVVNGVKVKWSDPSQHGKFYSGSYTADSTNASCQDCHGAAITFNKSQTKKILSDQSKCYGCHWTYPHTGFDTGQGIDKWAPAKNTPGGLGHVYYLMNSPLLTDSTGAPPAHLDDPILITPSKPGVVPVIQYTCGGNSPNNCHFNGYRTTPPKPKPFSTKLCGGYCHKP